MMREIVDKHFPDNWVISAYMGESNSAFCRVLFLFLWQLRDGNADYNTLAILQAWLPGCLMPGSPTRWLQILNHVDKVHDNDLQHCITLSQKQRIFPINASGCIIWEKVTWSVNFRRGFNPPPFGNFRKHLTLLPRKFPRNPEKKQKLFLVKPMNESRLSTEMDSGIPRKLEFFRN
jgi:hypothetical protein